MGGDIKLTDHIAVIIADRRLSPQERTDLSAALATIPNADVGALTDRDGMGMTAKEMALTVALSISANFATEAIQAAIDASGLAERLTLETVLPAPKPAGAPLDPVSAPPREED